MMLLNYVILYGEVFLVFLNGVDRIIETSGNIKYWNSTAP